MINKLAAYIVDKAVDNNRILMTEREIYRYGYTTLIESLICTGCSFCIGSLFGQIIPLLLFLISFSVLRMFGGGYHANRAWKCILLSAFMIVVFCTIIQIDAMIEKNEYVLVMAGIGTLVVFKIRSKVALENQDLEKRCTVLTRIIYVTLLGISTISHFNGLYQYTCSIAIALLTWLMARLLVCLKQDCNNKSL